MGGREGGREGGGRERWREGGGKEGGREGGVVSSNAANTEERKRKH